MRADVQPRIAVQRRFTARHAVTIDGVEEEPHAHDWHVQVEVRGELDDEGLLIAFHLLERALGARPCAVAPVPFHGRGRGTRADLAPPAAWRAGVVGPGTHAPTHPRTHAP